MRTRSAGSTPASTQTAQASSRSWGSPGSPVARIAGVAGPVGRRVRWDRPWESRWGRRSVSRWVSRWAVGRGRGGRARWVRRWVRPTGWARRSSARRPSGVAVAEGVGFAVGTGGRRLGHRRSAVGLPVGLPVGVCRWAPGGSRPSGPVGDPLARARDDLEGGLRVARRRAAGRPRPGTGTAQGRTKPGPPTHAEQRRVGVLVAGHHARSPGRRRPCCGCSGARRLRWPGAGRQVVVAAAEVDRRGEAGVVDVLGVAPPVAVGVHADDGPGRGDELHRADGAVEALCRRRAARRRCRRCGRWRAWPVSRGPRSPGARRRRRSSARRRSGRGCSRPCRSRRSAAR